MAVNLFGNIDGRNYLPPTVDLFETVHTQNNQQDNSAQAVFRKCDIPVKVNISQDGLRALHGSKLNGSMNLDEITDQLKYISEHQPIESFTYRFSRMMPNEYLQTENRGTSVAEEKGNVLLNGFKSICDEIVLGYACGNRVRYIEDDMSEDGFAKISEAEELSILLEEFSIFVESRFGKQHQEYAIRVAEQTNDIQKTKLRLGLGTNRYYEPMQIPDGFVEKMIADAKSYIEAC